MDRRQFLYQLGGGMAAPFIPCRVVLSNDRTLLGYIRTNWSRDPFSYGSYSYVAKGASRRDRRALEKPVDNKIFFAGEAVHPKRNSTVHAAYESGQRTADLVLETGAQRIGIIGAGMSGLSAARKMSTAGRQVTVLEARDRIGGRVWTDRRLDYPLDLGASWIHGTTNNPLTNLADEAKQERIPTDDSYLIRGKDNRMVSDGNAPSWLENVVSVQHSAGADWEDINRTAYLFDDDYDGPEVIFPGGYDPIFSTLRGDYDVKLSTTVNEVHITERGVTLQSDVSELSFDAVIVTIPLGVLKKGDVRFDPPLPDKKQRAVNRLGMGTLDKVYLRFDRPFWDERVTWIITPENDLPPGQFNQWLNLYRYYGEPIIMAFNGGPPALDLADLSDEELVNKAMQTLMLAYP